MCAKVLENRTFIPHCTSWETVWLNMCSHCCINRGFLTERLANFFTPSQKSLRDRCIFSQARTTACSLWNWVTDCKTHTHTHTSDSPPPPPSVLPPWRSRKRLKIGSIKGMLWQGHMRRMYLCKREICSLTFLPLFLMWKFRKEPKQLRSGPFIFL